VGDSALSNGCQAQSPPEHITRPTSIRVSQDKSTNSFPIPNLPTQTPIPIPFNHENRESHLDQQQQLLDIELWKGDIHSPTTMPFFGGDSFARLPFAIPDDFIQFIFNEKEFNNTTNDCSSPAGGLTKWVFFHIQTNKSCGNDT